MKERERVCVCVLGEECEGIKVKNEENKTNMNRIAGILEYYHMCLNAVR